MKKESSDDIEIEIEDDKNSNDESEKLVNENKDSGSKDFESEDIEKLEDIVNETATNYPRKITNVINPSLEINEEATQLESGLRDVRSNSGAETEAENRGAGAQSNLNTNYMSTSYQLSNYESSIYPKMITSQETTLFRPANAGMIDTSGYPKEAEIRKYEPISRETKRSRRRI